MMNFNIRSNILSVRSILVLAASTTLLYSCSGKKGGGTNSETANNSTVSPTCDKDSLTCLNGYNPSQLNSDKMIKACDSGKIQLNDVCDTLTFKFKNKKEISQSGYFSSFSLAGKSTGELVMSRETDESDKHKNILKNGKYFNNDEYKYPNIYWEYQSAKKSIVSYSKIDFNLSDSASSALVFKEEDRNKYPLNMDFEFDGIVFKSENVDFKNICNNILDKYRAFDPTNYYGSYTESETGDVAYCRSLAIGFSINAKKNNSGSWNIVELSF